MERQYKYEIEYYEREDHSQKMFFVFAEKGDEIAGFLSCEVHGLDVAIEMIDDVLTGKAESYDETGNIYTLKVYPDYIALENQRCDYHKTPFTALSWFR